MPETVKTKIAYDFHGTLARLTHGWTERQLAPLDIFPARVRNGLAGCRSFPQLGFMDDEAWCDTDWQELLFKLWIIRVLGYTVTVALRGYDVAMHHLHRMVESYARRAARAP